MPVAFLAGLVPALCLPPGEAAAAGTRYNAPLLHALVLAVGARAVEDIAAAPEAVTLTRGAHMDLFQHLAAALDTEGRYLLVTALANQLRYPNSHTQYFSCVLLFLFAEAPREIVQEQITRVLLERLIVNRPHPWGLLITFIELIQNRAYNFWSHDFVHCASEIERLFESVARSCMTASRVPGDGVGAAPPRPCCPPPRRDPASAALCA